MDRLKDIEAYLNRKGLDTTPVKLPIQTDTDNIGEVLAFVMMQNEQLAEMVAVLMSEVETLKGGGTSA